MCNYNMADTLDRAIASVVEQLDDRFEVLVIDDGSSDGSLEILQDLAARYDRFRYIALPRDRNRQLGETRNISIRAARGEYVLVGMDADDVWDPYLPDFVTLFHKIEAQAGRDIYLSGQQTGMAKRALLLPHGPYRNIYRSEDRDMLMRLAERNSVLFLDYKVYRTRLDRPASIRLSKAMWDQWSQMIVDLRGPIRPLRYIADTLAAPLTGGPIPLSMKLRLFRVAIVLPAFVVSRFMEKIRVGLTWPEMLDYQKRNRGTYAETMARLDGDPDVSFLSQAAQEIFSHGVKTPGFGGSA